MPYCGTRVFMCHLGDKDVRGPGNTMAGAVLLRGHHAVVSETIICFPCLEYKIFSVSVLEQTRKITSLK